MTKLAYVDLESTGLDPSRHEIWELAIIIEDGGPPTEYVWQLPVDLSRADPMALTIGRFYDRRSVLAGGDRPVDTLLEVLEPRERWKSTFQPKAAERVAGLLAGAHMVGAVPSFDASFLGPWLRSHGQCPTWSHRLRCVETLVAGHLGREVGGLADCAEAMAVEFHTSAQHTALGDARVAREIYRQVIA